LSAHLVIDLVLSLYRSVMRISKNYRHENGTEDTTPKTTKTLKSVQQKWLCSIVHCILCYNGLLALCHCTSKRDPGCFPVAISTEQRLRKGKESAGILRAVQKPIKPAWSITRIEQKR